MKIKNFKQFENLISDKNYLLSESEIEYLKSVGFKQNESKHSGYYYFEDDRKTIVLIPQEDKTYKLEFYELCDDGDGNFYDDYSKQYSKEGQSLEEFIESWF